MNRNAVTSRVAKYLSAGAALLLGAAAPTLRAGPVGLNIGEAGGFNLLTWGNATLVGSSMQGRAAVGGNAGFSGYSLGPGGTPANPATGSLIVGGNLAASNGTVQGGSIYTGGTYSGPGYNINNAAGSFVSANLGKANVPFDFAGAETALSARSLAYGGEAATGSSILQWSTLTLSGTRTDLNIFNIDSLTLSKASSLVIDVAAGSQVLINVSGSDVLFGNKGISANVGASDILYNFHEADKLTITGIGISGSVLASFADVNFSSGNLNGQLIAKSFGGTKWSTGSFGMSGFNNHVIPPPPASVGTDHSPIHSVPDAGGTGALLLGALTLGFAGRRLLGSR